jgi:hypothetical protein
LDDEVQESHPILDLEGTFRTIDAFKIRKHNYRGGLKDHTHRSPETPIDL